MKRYTIKDLRRDAEFTNDYPLCNSEYRIKIVPQYGSYYLYQQRKDCKDGRVVRLLFAGTARECGIYLNGFRAAYWYFYETTDLPF